MPVHSFNFERIQRAQTVKMLPGFYLNVWIVFCVIIATSLTNASRVSSYRACAPRHSCVGFSRCPRTSALFHRARDVTAVINLLHQYLCGLSGDRLEVCCHQTFTLPPSGALLEDASVEREGDDNIDDHPNLRLVNQHECGASIKNRIVGGVATVPGEFPWLALLQYQMTDGRLDFLCGGSIISSRHVLTAAHCIPSTDDPFKTLMGVRLGEYNVRTADDCAMNGNADEEGVVICAVNPPKDYKIARVISHPQFVRTGVYEHDIALIRLKQRILIDPPFVVPVCLPTGDVESSDESLESARFEVAGWGVTGAGLWTSDVLLKVAVPYVNPTSCERRIGQRLRPGHLCAGGAGGKGPCSGDSGGPLMHTVGGGRRARVCYQVGVVSVAIDGCEANTPGVYTRVRPYLRWILDNLTE